MHSAWPLYSAFWAWLEDSCLSFCSMVGTVNYVKSELPNGIIEDFPAFLSSDIDRQANGQCNADNPDNIGNQASGCDFRAFHRENMPCSVHQHMQPDRNPYVEIPLDVHPTEVQRSDKGHTESGQWRKDIVSLIKMHGSEIKCRQYDSPEETSSCIPEKHTEHKSSEHQFFLKPGEDALIIKHLESQLRIEVAVKRKYKIQWQRANDSCSKSFEKISIQPEKRKYFLIFYYNCRQNKSHKHKEQCLRELLLSCLCFSRREW